ncbi:thylakoid membrane photosystem I accumulation factor [Anabaena sp. UHCC 0399]|uniref:thylakoid membrane photosystem I accumulation factor n=1 Tax=Anabaena sp. UHCC 0399 TaxID=3110238 RepID=UPI002B1ED704|nr:thylakoid membrane photosystem I accumulation factor [Anabaena sp. UHCC 0399]MEA5566700.1 thylakoid membrane photosystem I accumulation factor [Anabaena sp. UHCC 0399]
MISIMFSFLHKKNADWRRLVSKCLFLLTLLLIVSTQSALAGVNDDLYDGNIFVVYAGNGSLVPPKVTLAQSLAEHKPTVLAFYLDDSRDCKQYAIVISRIQEFYGQVAEIMPLNIDTIPAKQSYEPTEPGYYYTGGVPQVVVFNQSGEVVLNKQGQVAYEDIDDSLRKVFDLLPRTETTQLKRRSFNEFSSELAK